MNFAPILLLSPVLLVLAAGLAFASTGLRPRVALAVTEVVAALVFGLSAVLAASFAAGAPAWPFGDALAWTRQFVGLDAVSAIATSVVSFIGWIVLRYSRTYLDGEARQGAFAGWICLTLASVLLFVAASHLAVMFVAWVTTSLSLHRLLLFYPDRRGAQRAAAKKFVFARAGDVFLAGGFIALWAGAGTASIPDLRAAALASPEALWLQAAAALLVAAALLKSAVFPTQGWLTEVMEAPTPVSALLHAGVINAGGLLLIRFADLLMMSPLVMAGLVIVAGLSALIAAMVMLAQSAVKTSLAWSTVAQMSFMLLQCGLGLWAFALLHICAHSLYKAHAFLSSGSAVAQVAAIRRPGPVAIPRSGAVVRAFALAIGVYVIVGALFGLGDKPPQALALGAMLIFGVAYLVAQGLADEAPLALTWRTLAASTVAAISYFVLQAAAEIATRGVLPLPNAPGPLEWALMALSVATFGAVAVLQSLFPIWSRHPAASGLRVHLANGLYSNAIADRLLRTFSRPIHVRP